MRLAPSSRDRRALWVGAAVLVAAGVVRLCPPAVRALGNAHADVRRERVLLERDLLAIAEAQSAHAQLTLQRSTLVRRKHNVFVAAERIGAEAAALRYVESIAQLAQVSLQSVQVDPDLKASSGQTVPLPITLAIESDAARVFTFLQLLESGAFIRLRALKIAPAEVQPAMLSLKCTIVLYALINGRGTEGG